jgi:NDP-sugar pyrophosphorylase family protein
MAFASGNAYLNTSKLVDFSQHKVTAEKDVSDTHKDIINGGFMVFKREVLDLLEPDSMIESIFTKLAKKLKKIVKNLSLKIKCADMAQN